MLFLLYCHIFFFAIALSPRSNEWYMRVCVRVFMCKISILIALINETVTHFNFMQFYEHTMEIKCHRVRVCVYVGKFVSHRTELIIIIIS